MPEPPAFAVARDMSPHDETTADTYHRVEWQVPEPKPPREVKPQRFRTRGGVDVAWDRSTGEVGNAPGLGGPRPTYLPRGAPARHAKPVTRPTAPFVRVRGNQRVAK